MLTFLKSAGLRVSVATTPEPAKVDNSEVEPAPTAPSEVPNSEPVPAAPAGADVVSIHSVNSSASLNTSLPKSSNTDAYGAPSVGRATPQAPSRPLSPVQSLLVPPSPGVNPAAESISKPTSEDTSPYLHAKAGKDPNRFSFRSFTFMRPESKLSEPERKTSQTSAFVHTQPQVLSEAREKEKKARARKAFTVRALQSKISDKRAKDSAMAVRSVIMGDHEVAVDAKGKKSKPVSKSDLTRVRAQLLEPKSAAKVIDHLRAMSPTGTGTMKCGPIHAVCLDTTDKEAHEQYFAQIGSVASSTVSALSTALANIHVVDLLTAPDMGFGAPASSPGLLAGAVPSAEAIMDGLEQITPQLLAFGYATSNAILPDHKSVIVPTDRISALTYWWGFEICLPPPTMKHLDTAASPATTLLNLLTALSIISPGVREVLPFIRYVAQFVQTEWHMIKSVDKGKGVVCCATWILPPALVARAWDFADPPPTATIVVGPGANLAPTASRPGTIATTSKPSISMDIPRASSAFTGETGEEERRHVISSDPPVLPELVVSSSTSNEGKPSIDLEVHKPSADVPRDAESIAL